MGVPEQVGPYEIRAEIGRGGMGMVYRARDLTLDRTVALKFLPPSLSTDQDAKERFVHEAKAVSGLDHPNIATVHEIGETEDRQLFIAMEMLSGRTMVDILEREFPLADHRIVDLLCQVCDVLVGSRQALATVNHD